MHVLAEQTQRKTKTFQPTFSSSLLFFWSMSTRLLFLSRRSHCVLLLCQPLCHLPLLFHVAPMCVTYVCVLLRAVSEISPAFPFLLACCLISSAWHTLSLCQSYALSHAWAQGSHVHQPTQKDIQILLHIVLDLSVTGIRHNYKHPDIKLYCVLQC